MFGVCNRCRAKTYGTDIHNIFFCADCYTFHYSDCYAIANQVNAIFNIPNNEDEMQQIIISNGDTEDWVSLRLSSFLPKSNSFEVIIGFIKVTIHSSDRNYDPKRRAWFIKANLVDTFLTGLKIVVDKLNKDNPNWHTIQIEDQREKYESFDEFFKQPESGSISGKAKKTKDELIADLINMLGIGSKEDITRISARGNKDDFKKIYRAAAMKYHPDKNNGDGSRMSELNMIWNQLQEML